jgi:hypothetical protein
MERAHMSLITTLILTFCNCLPWLAIAAVAALTAGRQKNSLALFLQTASAAFLFLLPLGRWLVVNLLLETLIKTSLEIIRDTQIIFSFLLFVSLLAFAVGYCVERLARRKPTQVPATPA